MTGPLAAWQRLNELKKEKKKSPTAQSLYRCIHSLKGETIPKGASTALWLGIAELLIELTEISV